MHKREQLVQTSQGRSRDLRLGMRPQRWHSWPTPLATVCNNPPVRHPLSPARMMVYSGLINKSALLYDSLQTENVPFEGLLSEGNGIRIEFLSDQARAASAFNIRFEGEGPQGLPPSWVMAWARRKHGRAGLGPGS